MKAILYDTTLRDGSQGERVSFSIEDKFKIIKALDMIGIDYIEGGFPASNPKDMEFFKKARKVKLRSSKLVAFGSTKRPGFLVEEDQGLKGLIKSGTEYITIFGKTSKLHVKRILKTTLDDNLKIIEESVKFLTKHNRKIFYDAEHFFDGFLEDKDYAIKTLKMAEKGGALEIILCDTNGGMMPWQIVDIIKEVKKHISIPLGIHCHNDSGMALANSLEAFRSGCMHIQGTVNGLGERTGNADIITIIANLRLKMGVRCVNLNQLKKLTYVSRLVYDILNFLPSKRKPYVGTSAFVHKAGMHIDGVKKTGGVGFEHINPELVGNERSFLISELAGRSALVSKIKELLPRIRISKISTKLNEIFKELKFREKKGYQYEAAEASFVLLVEELLGKFFPKFYVKYYSVNVSGNVGNSLSEAQVVIVDKNMKEYFSKQTGNGPIDALANSLYDAVSKVYPEVSKIKPIDYKIKVLDGDSGSSAVARVWIEFRTGKKTWATVSVSTNTIEASLEALIEGLEYGLEFALNK